MFSRLKFGLTKMLIKPTASFYKKSPVTSVTRVTSLINKGLQRVTPRKNEIVTDVAHWLKRCYIF